MNEFLKIILSLSLSGALLIIILLLFRPLVKDRLSKRWQYYIWLIVVIRLLLPLAPETNLMGALFQHFDPAVIQADTSPQPGMDGPISPEIKFSGSDNELNQTGTGGSEHLESEKQPVPQTSGMSNQKIAVLCLLVWLIVAVSLFIRKITVYQSFVKYLNAGRMEVSDMALWERVGELVGQTGINTAVGLYTNSLISSPLLIGFFRPCIMLPTTELPESDFQYTILHELTHYKRRDMFYKWLVQVTVCLHWFNPFVYLMSREVGRTCELSCDEAVIKTLDAQGRLAYGNTLLNAMGAGGNYKSSLASVTLNESKERLKERLDAIMKYKKRSRTTFCMTFVLTIFFSIGAFAAGVYAAPPIDRASAVLPAENTPDAINEDSGISSAEKKEGDSDGWDRVWEGFDDAFKGFDDAFEGFDDAFEGFDDAFCDFPSGDRSHSGGQNYVNLINTKQWPIRNLSEIEISYISDGVELHTSPTDEIILKEYMTENDPDYYAKTSIAKSTLKIDRGERPDSSRSYRSIIEIFIPADYSGKVTLNTVSGRINVNDYEGDMDCHSTSGSITISDCKITGQVESVSGRINILKNDGALDCSTKSGLITVSDSILSGTIDSISGSVNVELKELSGDLEINSVSGRITVTIPGTAAFCIQAETISGVVKNNFSDSFGGSKRFVDGDWGRNPENKIELNSTSGSVEINKK